MLQVAARLLPLLCLALAACGSSSGSGSGTGIAAPVECAPFARALSGVSLSGAAADWWHQADGRYVRSRVPEVGSVLVFRRSGRLPSGHVSVVSRVVSRRQILVTSANWVHGRVTEDEPVVDVSGDGDWSVVRVWWPPAGQIGVTDYGVYGFIRPDHPAGHDRLIAATPAAIRVAEQGW
jgi:hypothetical protein